MSEMTVDRLLTTEEAAELLQVKPQTLATWRCNKRHSLKYIKSHGLVRYRMRDLLQWLDDQTICNEEE